VIVIGLLAHNNPECLADTVASIHQYVHDPLVVLFNGGSKNQFTAVARKLDVEFCRYSRPLRHSRHLHHGNLFEFPIGIMRHLRDGGHRYDFLVTIDSDMLVVRDGFEAFLSREMAASGYMATFFRFLTSSVIAKWEIGRYFVHHWRKWQPLFGIVQPAGCFNPGQVFRRDFVDRILDFHLLSEILDAARISKLPTLEEIIYPTLAVALDTNPKTNPGSVAIDLRIYDSRQLRTFLADPSVFLLHKVQMDINSPDRVFLRAVRNGDIPKDFWVDHSLVQRNPASMLARAICKELYYKWMIAG
jgi:hypothetical protein